MNSDTGKNSVLLKTFKRVAYPMVQLMLRHGITFQSISDVLKEVMVHAAEDQLRDQNTKVNDSRISVATGVHRKDVRKIRHTLTNEEMIPGNVSVGTKVLNTWMNNPEWLRKDGCPRVLSRTDKEGDNHNFERLSRSVSSDVHPRSILDELLRIGVVKISHKDKIKLISDAFIPSEGFEEKLYFLQRAGYTHLMAAVNNVEGISDPFFERVVHYDTIPEKALPDLKKLLNTEGMKLLSTVNKATIQAADSKKSDLNHFTVGLYLFHEPVSDHSVEPEQD